MMYRVEIRRQARKEMTRLPRDARRRIVVAIDLLSQDPRPQGCRPVSAAPKGTYRVRVGAYRIVYIVEDDVLLVVVVRVARRGKSTYKGLG